MLALVGAALAIGTAVPAQAEATSAATVFWSSVVQIPSDACYNHGYQAIVGQGAVKRRNNYGFNRVATCLASSYGDWQFGTYYIGGGVKVCSVSGSIVLTCSLVGTTQSDPFIKNNGIGNANGEGSFIY